MENLPDEIIKILLAELSPKEIVSLCTLRKQFASICHDDTFWQDIVNRNWPGQYMLPWYRTWRNLVHYLINDSKLVPIYDNNRRLLVLLKLYKTTNVDTLQMINKLNDTINMSNPGDVPIIDGNRDDLIGELVSHGRRIRYLYCLISWKNLRAMIYILAYKMPELYGDETRVDIISMSTESLKINWQGFLTSLSQLPLGNIVQSSSEPIPYPVSLYDIITEIII